MAPEVKITPPSASSPKTNDPVSRSKSEPDVAYVAPGRVDNSRLSAIQLFG